MLIHIGMASICPAEDSPHLRALGMLESGNNDNARGIHGEISRYQISPYIWKKYGRGMPQYMATNANLASRVVVIYMQLNAGKMSNKVGRAPTNLDSYVLWNLGYTKYNRYFGCQFEKLPQLLKNKAFYYTNLITMYSSNN